VPNSHYRCYFTDDDDRIRAVEQIACEGDADAVLKVEHLPAASIYRTAELWQGARLVGKWERPANLPRHPARSSR